MNDTHPTLPIETHIPRIKRPWLWPVIGGCLGFVGGMLDYVLVRSLGVQMSLDGQDVSLGVVLFFAVNIGALGALVGWLRVQRTQLKHQNTHIATQQRALIAKERALVENRSLATIGRLSSGVAHEVRNPLAIIRASASLITEEIPDDQRSHEVACFIRDEVDRLDGFVGRLMDYTRRLEPNPRAITIASLLARQRLLTQAHTRVQSGEITLELPAIGDDVVCMADEDLLERQLLTLLHNALEAATHTVEIRVFHAQSQLVRIEIADDGAGIAEHDRAHIFEPFFTTKSTGTGLGLAMAKKIADLHQHMLHDDPERGLGECGACFTISLKEHSS